MVEPEETIRDATIPSCAECGYHIVTLEDAFANSVRCMRCGRLTPLEWKERTETEQEARR